VAGRAARLGQAAGACRLDAALQLTLSMPLAAAPPPLEEAKAFMPLRFQRRAHALHSTGKREGPSRNMGLSCVQQKAHGPMRLTAAPAFRFLLCLHVA
jgi:hypothetical protein